MFPQINLPIMTPNEFKDFRRRHKASIIELASIVGIDSSKIAAFELGYDDLTLETIEMLCEAIRKFDELRNERLFQRIHEITELLDDCQDLEDDRE